MDVESLVEVISAAHLSHYVESPFRERGGIMLVGPPASFKTAITEVLDCYPNANLVADLTIKQASRLRDDLAGGRIITMGFTDFAKLYQRHSSTASNIEGFVRAITAEGFRMVNWEDSRAQALPARALVIGCMTQAFYMQHYSNWKDDGFARRFLWSFFRLLNPEIIIDAIIRDTRIEFSSHGFSPRIPTSNTIPMSCTIQEAQHLNHILRYQEGREVGLILLKKILSALKWKFPKDKKRPMQIVEQFAESLRKEGTTLHV